MGCGLSRASRTDILWTNIVSEAWLQRPRDIKLQAVTSALRQVDIYYVLSHLKILTFIQYIQQRQLHMNKYVQFPEVKTLLNMFHIHHKKNFEYSKTKRKQGKA